MIIGIDGNEANINGRVGISEYAYQLLEQFSRLHKFGVTFRIYLKSFPIVDMPFAQTDWKYRLVEPRFIWTQIGLPFDLYRHKPRPSVFFTPTHYAPRFSPVPVVISIMDLSYIHFPKLFKRKDLYQLKHWTKYSVDMAVKIVTISQASKNDIIKLYHVPSEKVVVTYPGSKMQSKHMKKNEQRFDSLSKKFGLASKYVLFVGTLQPRKNITRLIEAFSYVAGSQKDLELLVVGKKGWLFQDIMAAPRKYNVESKVKFLEFVTNEELSLLYQNASLFVLPSLYEGFGLPVIEAMANGCPVVISNVSSLPEAGGDAALYVDPNDPNDIAEKIKLVLTNESLRDQLIKKGYKQANKFSWEKTAKETLKVLMEVAA